MRQGLKAHACNATIHLPRAIILVGGIAAALAVYFVLSLYLLPQSFQEEATPPRPEPIVSNVTLSSRQLVLGETLRVSVEGTNAGDTSDMQIVSVGFPNLTGTGDIEILRHDFR